jgi:hypothetical protein
VGNAWKEGIVRRGQENRWDRKVDRGIIVEMEEETVERVCCGGEMTGNGEVYEKWFLWEICGRNSWRDCVIRGWEGIEAKSCKWGYIVNYQR